MSTATTETPQVATDVLDEVAQAVLAFATCDQNATGAETAYVRLIGPNGKVLDLCKHHYETNEVALLFKGFAVVIDTRSTLEPEPTHPSA